MAAWTVLLGWVAVAGYFVFGPGRGEGVPALVLGAAAVFVFVDALEPLGWRERFNPGTVEANKAWALGAGAALVLLALGVGLIGPAAVGDVAWYLGTWALSAPMLLYAGMVAFLRLINPLYAGGAGVASETSPAPAAEERKPAEYWEPLSREDMLQRAAAEHRKSEMAALDTAATLLHIYGTESTLSIGSLSYSAVRRVVEQCTPQTREAYDRGEERGLWLDGCIRALLAEHADAIHAQYGGLMSLDVATGRGASVPTVTVRFHVQTILREADPRTSKTTEGDALAQEIEAAAREAQQAQRRR